MQTYYIKSTKYSIRERQTVKGKVYDVYFRVVDKVTLKEHQKKLSGFKTKTLAKQGYADFVTAYCELLRDKSIIKKKDPAKDKLIVEPLISEYIATLFNQNKESTIYSKMFIYRDFIIPFLGNKTLEELTVQELYRWQDQVWQLKNPKTQTFYSSKYLSAIRGHLSTFLSWCETRFGVKNHMPEVKRPKPRGTKTKIKVWTKQDFEKFIAVVDNPTYHALFTFLFYTGRRKGEILALSPADVQPDKITFNKSVTRKTFDNSTFKITSTKADKSATLPVCKAVQQEIINYAPYKGYPFYFGGNKPLSENAIVKYFDTRCNIAQVPRIRIHDLRHSFVSMLIHLGANMTVVADLISDTLEQVSKTYAHMYETDQISIINKL